MALPWINKGSTAFWLPHWQGRVVPLRSPNKTGFQRQKVEATGERRSYLRPIGRPSVRSDVRRLDNTVGFAGDENLLPSLSSLPQPMAARGGREELSSSESADWATAEETAQTPPSSLFTSNPLASPRSPATGIDAETRHGRRSRLTSSPARTV